MPSCAWGSAREHGGGGAGLLSLTQPCRDGRGHEDERGEAHHEGERPHRDGERAHLEARGVGAGASRASLGEEQQWDEHGAKCGSARADAPAWGSAAGASSVYCWKQYSGDNHPQEPPEHQDDQAWLLVLLTQPQQEEPLVLVQSEQLLPPHCDVPLAEVALQAVRCISPPPAPGPPSSPGGWLRKPRG